MSLGTGGSERQIVGIANGLHRRGWKVAILQLAPRADPSAPLDEGIAMISLTGGAVRRALQARREIRNWPTVVTFLFWANILGRFAPRGPRVITSIRSVWFGARWRHLLLRFRTRREATAVTNSSTAARELAQRHLVRRTTTIPNGCNIAERRPPPRRIRRFVCIANLRREKGHDLLLEALSEVESAHVDFIGGGDAMPKLKEIAAQHGVTDRVMWHGYVADAIPFLREADALVLPSRTESSPNAAIEAMAHGVPVVATSVGGTTGLLEDGRGILAAPEVHGLARAMRRLMEMPTDDVALMTRAAHRYVTEHHGWEAVLDAWERLLSAPRNG